MESYQKTSASQRDYDLLVIGCGPAGQRAAVQASKLRKKVAIVDAREVVGGVCVNAGTIPSKSFKEAVTYLSGYRQRSVYGAGYRYKAKVSMDDLTFRINHNMQTEIEVIGHQLARNHIDIISGFASFLDPYTVEVSSDAGKRRFTSDYFVISTGASPYRPEGIDFDGVTIFDSDNILSLNELPRQMTVVGGGVIGTEYASMFAALGVQVTIIDGRKRLLGFLDEEIIECLQYQLRGMGVTLRLGEVVQTVKQREDGQVVCSLESGKVAVSDVVLFSAGRRSSTKNLGLEKIGVSLAERDKIPVNEQFQTEVPHVYAAGDVVGFPALASTSAEQGRRAAAHAFELDEPFLEYPLPFGIYSIPEISYSGATEQELTEQGVPYETGIARYREIARGQLLGDQHGMLKILFHRETKKLHGIHIIGEYATELIHIGQAVMGLGGGLDYLKGAVFNYPTLAECYKVAALDGYNKLTQ